MHEPPKTVDLASKIICAYVANNPVPGPSLSNLLLDVHRAITDLSRCDGTGTRKLTEAEIKASIRPDTLISFEDGKPYKALRRHLTMRGLTPEAYRAKWGLPVDYPLVSPTYSARRSKISQTIGRNRALRLQMAAE
ncbi:MucR family transcriptional regulator [Methylobacterium sp. A54F]